MIKVAVTGGAGQIAYSLLFRLASGEVFGNQPLAIHILEIPEALGALEGVAMELQDGAFPLLEQVVLGSDPYKVFEGVDWALLVGARPRGPGMERADLLQANGKIFVEQGRALNEVASRDVKVLVVGNPCNTNCLIALHNAPDLPRENFQAMTRLDQNRATAQLALQAGVPLRGASPVIIWGNHSSTQVPDFVHATIGQKPATEVLDRSWLEGEFFQVVQKRGAAIIKARGKSSAASAANAAIDHVKNWHGGGELFSAACWSEGNPYDLDEGLVFSFPCDTKGVVPGFTWDDFLEEKIRASEAELKQERDDVGSSL